MFITYKNNQLGELNKITCYGLEDLDSIPERSRDFSQHHRVETGSGNHTASSKMGTGNISQRIKPQEHEFNKAPPSITKV
jgi:hypothetical protein